MHRAESQHHREVTGPTATHKNTLWNGICVQRTDHQVTAVGNPPTANLCELLLRLEKHPSSASSASSAWNCSGLT